MRALEACYFRNTALRLRDLHSPGRRGDEETARKAGREHGARELAVSRAPFVIPYRAKDDETQILRVYHGARRWPETF
ncbi:MAG: hypothetical protein C3F11_13230 [Methylocystaceae bacterium]|nr:MAG: hypothetical protein C3F11_13230 [Methylocystaceae bacterium]